MITHFLGDEEVTAYYQDFAARLVELGDRFPKHWLVLGLSGRKTADGLIAHLPVHLQDQIVLGVANFDRQDDLIRFSDKTPFDTVDLSGQPVLLVDAAVHSGKSMFRLAERVQQAGAQDIISYTLVLKRSSIVVPTYFGVVIDDKDRIYFDLDVLPNNRLAKPAQFGVLRAIVPADIDRPIAGVIPPFVGIKVGDLVYDQETHDAHAYVFEHAGELVGFVNFRKLGGTLFIDGWFGAKRFSPDGQKMKIGGALLRWAETWGRSAKCDRIKLWAYEGAIDVYEYLKFKPTEPEWRNLGDGQRYRVMEREILYNIKITDERDVEFRS